MTEEIEGEVFEELVSAAERTVKEDRRLVEFLLCHMFSAYTTDPLNLGIEAPTSEGKTYPAVEVAKLFPREDVWLLGGLSPKSLIHERGKLVDREGNEIVPELFQRRAREAKDKGEREAILAELREKLLEARTLIDLDNKILIFLEDPSPETWAMLRPILSHDTEEISYKFTDKTAKGQLRTSHVVIRGWPAVIYLRTGRGQESPIWDQVQTRFATISPCMDARKYRAAIRFAAMQKGLPEPAFARIAGLGDRERAKAIICVVRQRLLEIKRRAREKTGRTNANIFWIPFYRELGEGFPAEIGRHMRDSKRFLALMQLSAAINVLNRPILEMDGAEYIVVTRQDYERAVRLYFEQSSEEILTGVPSHVIDFFKKVVLPLWDEKQSGLTTDEMVDKYKEISKKTMSANTIRRHYLPKLEDAGLVSGERDPSDKRRFLWRILRREVIPENWCKSVRFENARNFTLETLKERLNELIQIGAREVRIYTTDCENLNVDQLWDRYYGEGGSRARIEVSQNQVDLPENLDKNTCVLKTHLNAPIFTDKEETSPNEPVFLVEFLEDYPGGLVPKLRGPIPKGTVVVLPSPEALELKRVFGFVEVRCKR